MNTWKGKDDLISSRHLFTLTATLEVKKDSTLQSLSSHVRIAHDNPSDEANMISVKQLRRLNKRQGRSTVTLTHLRPDFLMNELGFKNNMKNKDKKEYKGKKKRKKKLKHTIVGGVCVCVYVCVSVINVLCIDL